MLLVVTAGAGQRREESVKAVQKEVELSDEIFLWIINTGLFLVSCGFSYELHDQQDNSIPFK